MAKLFKPKKEAPKEEKMSISDKFWAAIKTELPPPLEAKCQPLIYIGLAFFVAALVLVIIPSLRTMAPFSLLLSLLLFAFAYMRRSEFVFSGYDEYYFKTLEYTYLLKRQRDKGNPTGIMLLGVSGPEGTHVENEIFHVAVDSANNIPDLGCLLKVYVPKSAIVSVYGNRKFFSRVFAYDIEEYDI